MIRIGSYNYLRVKKSVTDGLLLSNDEQDILLPGAKVQDFAIGEELFVFVYPGKDGDLIASSKHPFACAGDFAFLKVVDVTSNGAYLDLGIEKDVFIGPKQKQPLEKNDKYVIYLYLDERDGRLTATTWIDDKVEKDISALEEGEEVSLLISSVSDLGYSAIINNRYMGLLYRDEVYEELEVGALVTGYVKKIRVDDQVDLSLRQPGFASILDAKTMVLEVLKEHGGVLALGDKSSPDEIRDQLKISKKAFKQAIGGLYKERLITMTEREIRLVPEEGD